MKTKLILILIPILVALIIAGIMFFNLRYKQPRIEETKAAVGDKRAVVSKIKKLHEEITSTKKAPIKIPQQGLAIRLAGTYKQGDNIVAYIEDLTTSRVGEYKVGDTVMGAAVIDILQGMVALVKDGRRIILTLKSSPLFENSDNWIEPVSNDRFVIDRARLNQRVSGINQLLTEVFAVPNISNGKLDGFAFALLKKNGVINQAGFKKGDIVKAVNRERLDSLKKPLDAYASLRQYLAEEKEPIVTVEVERDSKKYTFVYRILK